jgi:O-acetyl-ADP-ribose deacetylase (regulator of RNase III)
MPARITCVQGDLTREVVDAIVNAASEALRGGGGVDGAIHRAAGPGLLAELVERYPRGCRAGEAVLSGGHALPTRAVIHTVGPIWSGGARGEAQLLAACHHASIALAAREGLARVSFPAISCGVYGYPHAAAAEVALRATADALTRHPTVRAVRFVLFSSELHDVFEAARRRLGARPDRTPPP